ncbi:hypothetical protein OROHE_007348 [Orobanche hederae]
MTAGFQFEDVQIASKKSGFKFEDVQIFSMAHETESFQICKIKNKNSDLIDEDTLISEEDWKKPEYPPVGDPDVGRNACDGRRCALGDAFRCRTCPYMGSPRFEVAPEFPPPGN